MARAQDDDRGDPGLNPAARWLSALAGVLITTLGVFAILAARSDLAASVLVIVGGVFLLMAFTGRAVVGLRIANSELSLQAKVRAAREALVEGRDEQAYELLTEVDIATRRFRAPGMTPSDYEQVVLATLRALLPHGSVDQQVGGRDLGFDAVARVGDKRIVVQVYMGTLFTGRRLTDLLGRTLSADVKVDGLLVVVNGIPRISGVENIGRAAERLGIKVEVVTWLPTDPPGVLRDAAIRLIND